MKRLRIGVIAWFVLSVATAPFIGAMLRDAAEQFPLVETMRR